MDIEKIISEMTLEEKADFASGSDAWHTPAVERLGVQPIMMTDGPSGLRKMIFTDKGVETVKATCMPSAATQACSWNQELLYEVGKAIGTEARGEEVGVLLGPGINMKRSPLCGRNFEYYSEDPYLAGKMAAGYIKGLQSQGVGACVKHFAANNQETRRFSVSANVDMRTLREIYLRAFEIVVKEAKPKALMHSYNRINGQRVSDCRWLLTDILRKEWGFDGMVMSDWNAAMDRITALESGCDLEMPGTGRMGRRDVEVLKALQEGVLDEKVVDQAIRRILHVMSELLPEKNPEKADLEKNHEIASRLVDECLVLLKNEKKILPLKKGAPLAVIGEFARTPRYQGGGSSHVNPYKVDDLFPILCQMNGEENTEYARGYDLKAIDEGKEPEQALIEEAVLLAKKCGRAVLFVGMPESYESEGRDRKHMKMPEAHNRLIEAVTKAVPETVVVMLAGSPVEMPWLEQAKALLFAYLGGQALGGAIGRTLFGEVNPSGKLPETHPVRIEDTPSYLDFPGEGDDCNYNEGIFIGYRWYEKRKIPVNFPFGFGLSYTTFSYESICRQGNDILVRVKNTGDLAGKETMELYVGYLGENSFVKRPVKELRAFDKVFLKPGESKEIRFPMEERWFSYFQVEDGKWRTQAGEYGIFVGPSSAETPLTLTVEKEDLNAPHHLITLYTDLGDVVMGPEYAAARKYYCDRVFEYEPEFKNEVERNGYTMKNIYIRGFYDHSIGQLVLYRQPQWTMETAKEIVEEANRLILEGEK